MKKILLIILLSFCMVGCSNNNAVDPVKEYISKFKNHDAAIMSSLDELLEHENLTNEQNDIYKIIMKKQYNDLEYKVVNSTYNGDKAIIELEITVYDYQNSKKKASEHLNNHQEEYYDENGDLYEIKYKNLQLQYMKSERQRIKYTISFHVKYEKKQWILESPDYTVIQKIQGIYNYEE